MYDFCKLNSFSRLFYQITLSGTFKISSEWVVLCGMLVGSKKAPPAGLEPATQ